MLTFKAHAKPIYAMVFSPDGKRLATSSGDETVRLWNLDGPAEVRTFSGSQSVAPLAFSPDGRSLACGGRGFQLWEAESGNVMLIYGAYAESVAFAPDGKEVASFGSDSKLMRWSLTARQFLPAGWGGTRSDNRHKMFPAGAMAYSPDGKTIALCYGVHTGERFNSHLLLWDWATGELRKTLVADFQYAHPGMIAYSPDGSIIAGNYGPVLGVLNANTGEKVAAIKPAGKKHFKGLAFTPDGKRLIAVNTDAAVRVYDTATWAELTGYEWQIGKLTAVAVAPDGLRAAVAGDSGRVVVWDLDA